MMILVWRERRKIVYTEIVSTPLCDSGRNLEGDLEAEIAEGVGMALEDITAVS